MLKASREAKAITSWTDPDTEYEESLKKFVHAIFDDARFVADLEGFVGPLVEPGRVNSLTQTLVKLTAPGVPDVYQGNELWDLSLVDPDNRRPVDYDARRTLLRALRDAKVDEIMARSAEGMPKLWVVKQTLNLRRRRPELFWPRGNLHAALGRRANARARRVVPPWRRLRRRWLQGLR